MNARIAKKMLSKKRLGMYSWAQMERAYAKRNRFWKRGLSDYMYLEW